MRTVTRDISKRNVAIALLLAGFLHLGSDGCTEEGDDDTATPTPPPQDEYWRQSAMMVSDINGPRISFIRMSDGANLWDYNLFDHHPTQCTRDIEEPCLVWNAEHRTLDDRDVVDFFMTSNYDEKRHMGSLHRVAMDDPSTPIFSMVGLDFSEVENSGCGYGPETTCDQDAVGGLDYVCSLRFSHSMIVVEDDPEQKIVTFIVADTLNFRVVQATLDYTDGNTCARVDWIMNEHNPEWNPTCPPNAIQKLKVDDQDYLLVSCRNMEYSTGYGQIQLYRAEHGEGAVDWKRVWTYPDQESYGDMAYVNVPHHGRLFEDPDGGYMLAYAHSDGMGTEWGEGDVGTMGSAYLPTIESPPDYFVDEWVGPSYEEALFGFLRSVEILPGQERLVADSEAFIATPDGQEGVIHVFDAQTADNSGKPGYWTESYDQMELVEIGGLLEQTYRCGWNELFVAYWLEPSSLGSYMRDALQSSGEACF